LAPIFPLGVFDDNPDFEGFFSFFLFAALTDAFGLRADHRVGGFVTFITYQELRAF
jgi:hypothetical protein